MPDAVADPPELESGTAYGQIEEWVKLYSRELLHHANRIVGDAETAADCVQDAFIRAYRALERDETVEQPRAWLYRITRNIALNVQRSRAREAAAMSRMDPPAGFLADGHDERASRQVLADAIATLPPDELDVVRLRFSDDLTDREISEVLDIPLGTVKTRLRRARRRLADHGGLGTEENAG